MASADVVKKFQIAENVFRTFSALTTSSDFSKMIFSSLKFKKI